MKYIDYAKRFSDKGKQSGVYEIRNIMNDRFYIGRTKDLYSRILEHVTTLNSGLHCSPELQKDWDVYGMDAFVFTLLIYEKDPKKAHEKERTLIERFFDGGTICYNAKGPAPAHVRITQWIGSADTYQPE